MKLADFAVQYARRIGASDGYIEQLSVFTRRLDWEVGDITTDRVDEYLTGALAKLAPNTVANHRRMLTTLMAEARRLGLNQCILERFRRVKCPRPMPVAWSHADIRKLVMAARQTQGRIHDLEKSLLLEAWILSAYATGIRAGDLIQIKWEQIRGRRIYWVQSKTSTPHVAVFTDEALAACKALPQRVRVFGDFAALNTVQQWMATCVRQAGLRGSTKWLRRSCATYAKVQGRSPKAALGHLTDGLAEKHYVDMLLYEEEAGLAGEPLPSVF
jgi:integrase